MALAVAGIAAVKHSWHTLPHEPAGD